MFMGISLLVAAYCFGIYYLFITLIITGVLRGGRPAPTLVATVALLTSAAGLLGVQFFNWCLLSAVLTYVSVIFEIEEFIHGEQPLHQLQEQEQEEQERRPFVRPQRKRRSAPSSRMISAKRSTPSPDV